MSEEQAYCVFYFVGGFAWMILFNLITEGCLKF